MSLGVIVFCNPRLDFRDSRTLVWDFIGKRLVHGGLSNTFFVENRTDVAAKVSELKSSYKFLLIVDALNPIVDLELIKKMHHRLEETTFQACIADGAIPGTQPEVMFRTEGIADFSLDQFSLQSSNVLRQRWHTQQKYHNQFNIYKFKRLKMFLGLNRLLDGLHEYSIDNLCSKIEEDEVFNALVSYFEPVELITHSDCPHCSGAIFPLAPQISQPFLGYLPASRPYYFECEDCRLIVLSPAPTKDSIPKLYDDFDKQDFVVSVNNPYTADNPRCSFGEVRAILPQTVRSLDLGGGMGRFSQFLKSACANWQVTHSDLERYDQSSLEAEGISCRVLNFLEQEIGREEYDLITAWEVVEHIPFECLKSVFDNVHAALAPGGLFRFSTPDFDSPLCQGYDFYNACPPFHLTVLSSFWLRNYIDQDSSWKIVEFKSNSDFLDDTTNWFEYGRKTCPSFQLRGLSTVLKRVFQSQHRAELINDLLAEGMGTEVIVTIQKQ